MKTLASDLKRISSAPTTPEMMALEAFEAEARKETHTRWFIFNPAANKGKAKKYLKWLEKVLLERQEESVIQLTTQPGDAIEFSQSAKVKSELIVACGGDGTINEVAQSLIGTETCLAVLPMGSGNDFFKNLSKKRKLSDAFRMVIQGRERTIDVGKVTFVSNNQPHKRYFLNSFGLGFTGAIAKAARMSKRKGSLIYLDALCKVGSAYAATPMHLSLHTEHGRVVVSEPIYALSISNGKIEGGLFKIAPDASLNDGVLNLCALMAFPTWQLPLWVLRYWRGIQVQHKQVHYYRILSATISLSEPLHLHLDGEVFENVSGEIHVECVPNALKVKAS